MKFNSGTNRTLAWASAPSDEFPDGKLTPVNELADVHLRNCIMLLNRRLVGGKLAYGHLSLSKLSLDYLQAEAKDRGITIYDHQIIGLDTEVAESTPHEQPGTGANNP